MSRNRPCIPRVDLCIAKGADWSHDFIWQANDVAVDLTGYTARMQILDRADNSVVIADLSSGNGKLVITAAEGRVAAQLSYAETRAINQDAAIYDLLLKSPGGIRTHLAEGEIDFNAAETADVDS